MTEDQLEFAECWMALFNYDYVVIEHQLEVKKLTQNYSIDGFSDNESNEIWSYISNAAYNNLHEDS